MRTRGRQVVRREPPVELGRPGQRRQRVGRPGGEPAAPQPQRSGLGATGSCAVPEVGLLVALGAAILLGRPHRSMKPLASDWSKVSPVSYVAREKSYRDCSLRRPVTTARPPCSVIRTSPADGVVDVVEEAVERPLERAEPQPVVHQLGPALLETCRPKRARSRSTVTLASSACAVMSAIAPGASYTSRLLMPTSRSSTRSRRPTPCAPARRVQLLDRLQHRSPGGRRCATGAPRSNVTTTSSGSRGTAGSCGVGVDVLDRARSRCPRGSRSRPRGPTRSGRSSTAGSRPRGRSRRTGCSLGDRATHRGRRYAHCRPDPHTVELVEFAAEGAGRTPVDPLPRPGRLTGRSLASGAETRSARRFSSRIEGNPSALGRVVARRTLRRRTDCRQGCLQRPGRSLQLAQGRPGRRRSPACQAARVRRVPHRAGCGPDHGRRRRLQPPPAR